MKISTPQLNVVVLGAHLLTRSMHREIVLLLKHSPQYCFIVQRRDAPAAVAVIRATRVQYVGNDAFDDDTDPTDSVQHTAAELMRQCAHCVFASVDFSLPSARRLVSAAAETGTTVYIMHSAVGLHRAYRSFTESADNNSSTSTQGASSSSAELMRQLKIIHMVRECCTLAVI